MLEVGEIFSVKSKKLLRLTKGTRSQAVSRIAYRTASHQSIN